MSAKSPLALLKRPIVLNIIGQAFYTTGYLLTCGLANGLGSLSYCEPKFFASCWVIAALCFAFAAAFMLARQRNWPMAGYFAAMTVSAIVAVTVAVIVQYLFISQLLASVLAVSLSS